MSLLTSVWDANCSVQFSRQAKFTERKFSDSLINQPVFKATLGRTRSTNSAKQVRGQGSSSCNCDPESKIGDKAAACSSLPQPGGVLSWACPGSWGCPAQRSVRPRRQGRWSTCSSYGCPAHNNIQPLSVSGYFHFSTFLPVHQSSHNAVQQGASSGKYSVATWTQHKKTQPDLGSHGMGGGEGGGRGEEKREGVTGFEYPSQPQDHIMGKIVGERGTQNWGWWW